MNGNNEKYDLHILIEESTALYVNEPISEYKQQFEYQGTTINNAIKDYYLYETYKEKVSVLKWIVNNSEFQKLKRFSNTENFVYGLNISQYDDILLSGEMPNNLEIAKKFISNKFDVYLLSNPQSTKSADFIIRKNGALLYVEGKTSNGGSALLTRLIEGAKQSNRIAINFLHYPTVRTLISNIQEVFRKNFELQEVFIFKGSRLITIKRDEVYGKQFEEVFYMLWVKNKQKRR